VDECQIYAFFQAGYKFPIGLAESDFMETIGRMQASVAHLLDKCSPKAPFEIPEQRDSS
jgi:hypothetical protein